MSKPEERVGVVAHEEGEAPEVKSNYHYHRESGSNAVREHLRRFEKAKMERIVNANRETAAGRALRKKSLNGNVEEKVNWTREERWTRNDGDWYEEGVDNGRDGDNRASVTLVTTREVKQQQQQPQENPPVRKSSFWRKSGGGIFKAATGYVEKNDKFGMYPI